MRQICFHATVFLLALLLLPQLSFGQNMDYGHDWYVNDPNRTFIKFQVWEDGLYRATATDLNLAGYDLSGVAPAHLQLWYRGVEQPMHVAEDSLGDLVFLEFLGRRNDGDEDSQLYRNPVTGIQESGHQPHPEISLFSDTSVYYLTWDGTAGLRYQDQTNVNYGNFPTLQVFPYEATKAYHPDSLGTTWSNGGGSSYDAFFSLNSDYQTGEGYVGPSFEPGDSHTELISTPNPANLGSSKRIRIRLFGRSNTLHWPKISLNGLALFDTVINQNNIYVHTFERSSQQALTSQNTFLLESLLSGTDRHHLLQLSIRYLRGTNIAWASSTKISEWQSNQPSKFVFTQCSGTDSIWGFNPGTQTRFGGLITGDTAQLIAPANSSPQNIWVFTDQAIQTPAILPNHRFRHLCAPDSGAEFVIIAHRELASSAEAYATYRDTNSVNAYSTKVVYTDEIFEEFGYGSATPWAIKRFLNCAIENWTVSPQYAIFWGKGQSRLREFDSPIVPTYGYPATDFPFVEPYLPNSVSVLPQIPIGRIPVKTNGEGLSYLEKVNLFEHQGWQSWQRKGLFLSGGGTLSEQNFIQSGIDYYRQLFESPPFHGISRSLIKSDQNGNDLLMIPDSVLIPIQFGADSNGHPFIIQDLAADSLISAYVGNGLSWINFFGHSTSNLQEIPFGEPESYDNYGKFPFLFIQGSFATESSLSDSSTYVDRWLFEPLRGSIGALGANSVSYLSPLKDYGRILGHQLFDNPTSASIGDHVLQTLFTYTDSLIGIQYRNHGRQMMLFCDPAISIFPSPINPALTPVWPGDANNDGVADMVDLLNIGLAHGQTGSIRPGSLSWYAQPALDWPYWFQGGITNYKHADCDGNGTVEDIDTLATSLNYGLTHNKTGESNFTSTGIPLYLLYPDSVSEGDTIQVEVLLGDSLSQDSLYGIALQVQFDPEIVQDSLIWVDMGSSWLGTQGQNLLSMYRPHVIDGLIDLAFTRTDHQDTVGYGKLADISIVITDDIAKKERAAFLPWLSYGFAVNALGEEVPLQGIMTSIDSESWIDLSIHLYPNPASDLLMVRSPLSTLQRIKAYDPTGKCCYDSQGPFGSSIQINVSDWPSGTYLIQAETREGIASQKVIVR